MVEFDGHPIGSQSVCAKDFGIARTVETGSWLGQVYQGRGFGKEMRLAVLAFAFESLGAAITETEATSTNVRSIGVTRSVGYELDGSARHVVDGRAVDYVRARMSREVWRSKARPPIAVERLERCLPLFGATEA